MKREDQAYLANYLGEERALDIIKYLEDTSCALKLTKPRKTKRGDFRVNHKRMLITVNRDQNKYRFILTLAHEIAHLKTFIEFKHSVAPHGDEWKSNYFKVIARYKFHLDFIDDDGLQEVIRMELTNPKACSGVSLKRESILSAYDIEEEGVFLEDLEPGSKFIFRQHTYLKLESRRTRVMCLNVANKRKYTISKASKVVPLS